MPLLFLPCLRRENLAMTMRKYVSNFPDKLPEDEIKHPLAPYGENDQTPPVKPITPENRPKLKWMAPATLLATALKITFPITL
jgi:hypothetical protein